MGRCTLMTHTFSAPLDLHLQLGIYTLLGMVLMVQLLQTGGKIISNAELSFVNIS